MVNGGGDQFFFSGPKGGGIFLLGSKKGGHRMGSTLILDIEQYLFEVCNVQVDCAMSKKICPVLCIKPAYGGPNALAQKEGPSTFPCKSENANRQDWYNLL